MQPLFSIFPPEDYPDLLVGLDLPDDAAIWQLNDHRALVVTVDFFTPVVDDPYDFGAIAAANSLSDIYAMGGTPFLALNITALPQDLPIEISSAIIRGAAEKSKEAGVVIAGGHTIKDEEPKFGLAVVGMVKPGTFLTMRNLHAGDQLFLSKPLGLGIACTAHKLGLLSQEEYEEVTTWMKQLNRQVAELAGKFELKGATDITGFGLLGHASEMTAASHCGITLSWQAIPFIKSARKFSHYVPFSKGALYNQHYFMNNVSIDPLINEDEGMLLYDPQTSGGLLLAVPSEKSLRFIQFAKAYSIPIWRIGEVNNSQGIKVIV